MRKYPKAQRRYIDIYIIYILYVFKYLTENFHLDKN